jgi:hypothetical protein
MVLVVLASLGIQRRIAMMVAVQIYGRSYEDIGRPKAKNISSDNLAGVFVVSHR